MRNNDDPGRPLHAIRLDDGRVVLALGESITACSITLDRDGIAALADLLLDSEGNARDGR